MSKVKHGHSILSGLIDSDSDEGQFLDAMPTPDSAAENRGAAKKGRGRPKAAPAKVTKAKAPARRTSGRLSAKDKAPVEKKTKRPALADKTNQQHASDTEEVDDFDQPDATMEGTELEDTVVAVKEIKPKAMKKKPVGRPKAVKEISTTTNKSIDDTPQEPKVEARPTKKGRQAKQPLPEEPSPEKIVQETQSMEIDGGADEEVEVEATVSRTARHSARPRSDSRHRQPSLQRRRPGSASDTERSDPALRRKLGEITKKYESLNIKYQDMREIGLKEAERNFERLRKQSEEKTKSTF
jgi:hypothetical protein